MTRDFNDLDNLHEQLLIGLREGSIVPNLGAGVLSDVRNVANGAAYRRAVPIDSALPTLFKPMATPKPGAQLHRFGGRLRRFHH